MWIGDLGTSSSSSRDRDEAAIRQLVADAEAYQSDITRFPALLTDNIIIVNVAGIRVKGRDNFTRPMTEALETRLANVRTKTEIIEITVLGPGVALVSCIAHISDENAHVPAIGLSKGSLTYLAVQEEEGWPIALAQTTPIQGSGPSDLLGSSPAVTAAFPQPA
ncbi:MAG: SgcJ/EcaC family oxidoreductase [Chloroflexi bacterium]|nr:SgcJ/EcaC family oxidoreductase [Chloroflexota bacterium]